MIRPKFRRKSNTKHPWEISVGFPTEFSTKSLSVGKISKKKYFLYYPSENPSQIQWIRIRGKNPWENDCIAVVNMLVHMYLFLQISSKHDI